MEGTLTVRYLFLDASENTTFSQFGDGAGFFGHSFDTDRNLGARISEICNDMLTEAGCSFTDLDLLAVCTGPGSLTGLRVAAGFFRTLAFVSNKPLIGLDIFGWSLTTLQQQGVRGEIQLVLPTLIDKAFVVSAVAEDHALTYDPPKLCDRSEISGVQAFSIRCDLPGLRRLEPAQQALHDHLLSQQNRATKNFDDILGVLPLYVIPSQAERKLEEQK